MRGRGIWTAVVAVAAMLAVVALVATTASVGMFTTTVSGMATIIHDDGDVVSATDCDDLSGAALGGEAAPMGSGPAAFVDRFAPLAYRTGKRYGLPPEAILAQAAFESGWAMSAPQHNYFGIKVWAGCTGGATTGTQEDTGSGMVATTATWCGYPSAQAAYDGYGAFIRSNHRYDAALQYQRDPYKYLEAIWRAGYATDGAYMAKIGPIVHQITERIKATNIIPTSDRIQFDAAAPGESGAEGTGGTVVDACSTQAATAVAAGKVGGAPENAHDYSWMCSTTGVCRDGDGFSGDRIKYPHNVGRYQCVWYAWNRLGMIHGLDGWDWVLGNGGDIARNLSGKPGWTVDATPHAGDGISQVGGALGGAPPYGHVAVVEEVQTSGDGWRIRISEGNYGTGGNGAWTGYNSRWLTQSQFAGAGNVFFRYNTWRK